MMFMLMESVIKTPFGNLHAFFSEQGLHYLLWQTEVQDFLGDSVFQKNEKHPLAIKLKTELKEYFAGNRKSFSLPLVLHGTKFQIKAWQTLLKIPFGETRSYSEQAKLMKSNAVRAVGSANARNPINIIIPCHRVKKSTGEIGGYAAGTELKRKLLQIESL